MERPTKTDWSMSCLLCKDPFLTSQAVTNAEGFIVCPNCRQWSGHEFKNHKLRVSRCDIFAEDQDRLIGEMWAWVAVNPKTTLEGLCGVMIDNVPHRAISDTLEGAMKFLPFLDRVKRVSGKGFKLVKYKQIETYAEL